MVIYQRIGCKFVTLNILSVDREILSLFIIDTEEVFRPLGNWSYMQADGCRKKNSLQDLAQGWEIQPQTEKIQKMLKRLVLYKHKKCIVGPLKVFFRGV